MKNRITFDLQIRLDFGISQLAKFEPEKIIIPSRDLFADFSSAINFKMLESRPEDTLESLKTVKIVETAVETVENIETLETMEIVGTKETVDTVETVARL